MVTLLLGLACAPVPPADPVPVVLMVSFDTTRADAIGAYGGEGRTPTWDALARRGVRFARAFAHAPTTLSSHTSLMSGRDPHGHGVAGNGFPVPDDVPLIAETFADAGWDTLAAVGASVLEREMGLARGFRVYDDALATRVGPRFEQAADGVTTRAVRLLDGRLPGRPVFLFVHYFDAHTPWTSAPPRVRRVHSQPGYEGFVDGSPESLARLRQQVIAGTAAPEDVVEARRLYLSEVHWADAQAGRLLEALRQRGLDHDLLVVAFADHGEALHDLPARPYGHGPDVDPVATHVPLVLSGSGRFALPPGAVVATPVGLRHVAATVADIAGLASWDAQDSLAASWGSAAPAARAPEFLEATIPRRWQGGRRWNNLENERGVLLDDALWVTAPDRPEETRVWSMATLEVIADPSVAMRAQTLLARWDGAAPPGRAVELGARTRAALEQLGYLEP